MRAFQFSFIAALVLLLVGCGQTKSQFTNTTTTNSNSNSTSVSISITPTSASIDAGTTAQFQATVTGTQNTAVTWAVDGIAGGSASVGTISTTGLYTAPSTAGQHTVTATSQADASKSANAVVAVNTPTTPPPVAISISPGSASVAAGATQQFQATVTGTQNTAVIWSVDAIAGGNSTVGTISTGGLYTAPSTAGQHVVSATSAADTTKSANATVSVTVTTPPPSVAISISPTSASIAAGATQQFQAAVTGTQNTAVTWSVDTITGGNATVGTISTAGLYTAPSSAGQHVVTATSQADTTKSASATVTVTATPPPPPPSISVAISPKSATISTGQAQQFQATVTGTSNTAVTWSVDAITGGNSTVGTISASGLYTAPSTTGQHTVTATSVADTTKSGSATVTVNTPPPPPPPGSAAAVVTRSYDNMRSGVNGNETQLTPLNVTSATFGKLFSYSVDEHIYGQPLYVPNLTVGGKTHNVIFVATENDTVYAFDADQNTGGPLWQTSLLDAASGETAVPCADVDGCSIATVIGVTATPVISLANNAIYVEARSKLNGAYFHKLHALDLNTGAEKSGSPVTIQASVPGVGAESDSQGNVNFNPLRENDRGALLLVNNVVYLTFASLSDVIPYHGWVLGYSADTLQQVAVFNVTPNGGEGGIWANNGPAADGNGNIFAVVGNGTASAPNLNYGESYLKLSGTLKLLDYFMPFNSSTLNSTDVDVGSGGLLLLPDQAGTTHPHLLVAAGKEGRIYLVDRDNMGQFNAPGDTQIVQSLAPKTVGANFYSPVYWNGIVYFSGTGDVVKAFSLQNGLVSTTPVMQASTTFTFPGGGMVLSANGNASGILWVAEWHTSSHAGTLHAYDAQDLTHELWNSDQNATRDAEGNTTRLNVPLAINGKVYVGSNGKVLVYGLL